MVSSRVDLAHTFAMAWRCCLPLVAILSGTAVLPMWAMESGLSLENSYHQVLDADINNDVADDDATLSQRSFGVKASYRSILESEQREGIPVPLPVMWWENSLQFRSLHVGYELDADTDAIESFSGIGYRSMFSHRYAEDWSYTLIAGAKFAVDDLGEAELDDVQFSGGAQIAWHSGRENIIGVGLFYQQLLGESRVLPFPFLRYVSEGRTHSVSMMGPRLDYRYGFTREHAVGAFVQLDGERLLIVSETFNDYDKNGNQVSDDREAALAISQLMVGLGYHYRFERRWNAGLELGYVFARRFEIVDRDDGDPIRLSDGTAVDFDPDPALAFRLKAGVRF